MHTMFGERYGGIPNARVMVRNVTIPEALQYKELIKNVEGVTIDAKAGKLYYEEKPTETEIPWDIAIHYYLDGKEYNPEEIAGILLQLMPLLRT